MSDTTTQELPLEPSAIPSEPVPSAEPSPAPISEPSTLLGDEPTPEPDKSSEPVEPSPDAPVTEPETKPEEAPKVEGEPEPKKEEASQSDEPAPLPSYEAWTLPENIQMDDVKLGEFTKELAEFERDAGISHEKAQQFGQKLVDRYVAETQETVSRLNKYYVDTWEKQKTDWKDAFEADPEIGGNKKDTSIKNALSFIKSYGGSEDQQKELRSFMNQTGVGNNPALIRLLAKAGETLAEGKPLPASKPPAAAQSKVAKRYGSNA